MEWNGIDLNKWYPLTVARMMLLPFFAAICRRDGLFCVVFVS
jgi:hypothetical protein